MSITEAKKLYDQSDYCRFLTEFPQQIENARNLSIPELDVSKRDIHMVLIAGMGGSAISGELIQSVFRSELSVPVIVSRDYSLPACVDKHSLVILSSYSGNTEETLTSFKEAEKTKASLVCLTTGGKLGDYALTSNIPFIVLPKGYQPRAAIGFMFISMVLLLSRIGLLDDKFHEIDESVILLQQLRELYCSEHTISPSPLNLSEQIAGKIPVIYTGYAPFYALVNRWKCQFNENAKVPAFSNIIPEMNHNEIVGWEKSFACMKDIAAVFLRDMSEPPEIFKRIALTQEIIASQTGSFHEVWSTGTLLMSRMFSLLYFGDYASYYLALLNKKDPSTIENINFLKSKMG